MSNGAVTSGSVIVLLLFVAVYFLPTVVACLRDKAHALVGWLVGFVWACSGRTAREEREERRRHAELLAALRPRS